MNIHRRNFLITTAAAVPFAAATACFNATGLLQKINAVTNAAQSVLTTLDNILCPPGGSSCIAVPYAPLVDAWISSIQGANAKALAIANGAATLTSTQITDIIGIYAGALVFNIPGVPAAVTTVINAVVAAVDVLLSFLGATPAQTAAFKRSDFSAVPSIAAKLVTTLPTDRGVFFKEHVRGAIRLNNALGAHISANLAKAASAKAELGNRAVAGNCASCATSGFGSGGWGQ